MENLFISVKEFVSPEILAKLSRKLNEKEENIESASHSIIASLFEFILQKQQSKKLQKLLKSAGTSGILIDISNLLIENNLRIKKINRKLLNLLLGENIETFTAQIAASAQISNKNAGLLIKLISSLIAGFIGERLIAGIDFENILKQLEEEKTDFEFYIPVELNTIIEDNIKPFTLQKLWASLF